MAPEINQNSTNKFRPKFNIGSADTIKIAGISSLKNTGLTKANSKAPKFFQLKSKLLIPDPILFVNERYNSNKPEMRNAHAYNFR